MQMGENMEIREHRVGTITFGVTLIGFGILFLLNILIESIGYSLILKLWPILFILLGIEVLFANTKGDKIHIIYDKTAFILIALVTVFAICMASMSQMIQWGLMHPYS